MPAAAIAQTPSTPTTPPMAALAAKDSPEDVWSLLAALFVVFPEGVGTVEAWDDVAMEGELACERAGDVLVEEDGPSGASDADEDTWLEQCVKVLLLLAACVTSACSFVHTLVGYNHQYPGRIRRGSEN